jgi:hypothetical protein
MAFFNHRHTGCVARALGAMVLVCALTLGHHAAVGAEDGAAPSAAASSLPPDESVAEELPRGAEDKEGPNDSEFLDPNAADFGHWKPAEEEDEAFKDVELRPFDWMRHVGFRHSSTDGRFIDKNVPLVYSSWLNRPFHVDWFLGPLLSDDPVKDRVTQSNEIFGGLRAGWDFDYYWGLEWRFGWADPQIFNEGSTDAIRGQYFVSDFNAIYYPWGDTRVRPYFQLGLGITQIASANEDSTGHEVTLMGMPFGVGLQFSQTPWLAWRLEIVDNLAFGADDVDTMHNVAFTAGMEWRLGARPNSYWPWRSSRKIW